MDMLVVYIALLFPNFTEIQCSCNANNDVCAGRLIQARYDEW